MSLDLAQLIPQAEALAQEAAKRVHTTKDRLTRAQQTLNRAAVLDFEELKRRADRAYRALPGARWSGALPTEEPLNATYPPPAVPESLHVLGADGSQIYPDRHAPFVYYLINIGCFHLHLGSGQAPTTHIHSHLYFHEADLYDEPRERAMINGRRDVAEMAALAGMASACANEAALALLDNGLLLWVALQGWDPQDVRQLLDEYLNQMENIRATGAALAGFIDRPRHANVLALLHAASLEMDAIEEANLRANPYRGLTDRALFASLLPPGHRSARFTAASRLNLEKYAREDHLVQFFYLNTGGDAGVVRVEVPAWVGEDGERMAWVHAGLLEQGRTSGGFPFALVRAHELATVSQAERRSLESLLSQSLLRHGLAPRPSQKAVTKGWLGRRRRYQLR